MKRISPKIVKLNTRYCSIADPIDDTISYIIIVASYEFNLPSVMNDLYTHWGGGNIRIVYFQNQINPLLALL